MEMGVWRILTGACVLVCLFAFSPCECETTTSSLVDVITARDRRRLADVFQASVAFPDLATLYQSVKGLELTGSKLPSKLRDAACQYLKDNQGTSDLGNLFYATSVAALIGEGCKVTFSQAEDKARKILDGQPSAENIYFAVQTLTNIGAAISAETSQAVITKLLKAVETEESVASAGMAFSVGSLLPSSAGVNSLFEQIEDAVAQADETATSLYFEGGLKTTSLVIMGAFELASKLSKAPSITPVQAAKFGNYLVSSKYASSVSDAFYLMSSAAALAHNKYVVPVALVSTESGPITSSNPKLDVKLSNIFDEKVQSAVTVTLGDLQQPDGTKERRSKALTTEDNYIYSYNLFNDISTPGKYIVTLSTETKSDGPVAEIEEVEVTVTATYEVAVKSVRLSLEDKDQGVKVRTVSFNYPAKSTETIEADHHLKLVFTFELVNSKTGDAVSVHQAFVRFRSSGSEELYYVAEQKDRQYVLVVDVNKMGNDFGQNSGTYEASLVIGDFSIQNPLQWTMASVVLKFSGTPAEKKANPYAVKPTIEHQFRAPEKRPPATVSTTFTALVGLPLVLLLVVWLFLGANISNISNAGIWAVFFHISLGGIFVLYYLFWVELNMFQTLKYLTIIGAVTFITGNKMLRTIANNNKQA
eukprot:Em0005g1287a